MKSFPCVLAMAGATILSASSVSAGLANKVQVIGSVTTNSTSLDVQITTDSQGQSVLQYTIAWALIPYDDTQSQASNSLGQIVLKPSQVTKTLPASGETTIKVPLTTIEPDVYTETPVGYQIGDHKWWRLRGTVFGVYGQDNEVFTKSLDTTFYVQGANAS